jgi:hypothetical protein
MPIPLSCPCGRSIRARDELAGLRIKCPQCGGVLTVPSPEPAAPPKVDPWSEAPPRDESPQPAAAQEEELSEVLPADPDEADEDEDDEEMLSQRERVRRREAREKERVERRDEEDRTRRRRKSRRKRAFNALAEKGRFNVQGSRGYFGGVNAGVGCGVAMLVVGVIVVFLSLVAMSGAGRGVVVVPVGLIVGGIIAIARGMNR